MSEKLFEEEFIEDLVKRFRSEGIYIDNTVKLLKLFQLVRIADSLEDISAKLENMSNSVELLEKISDCVYEPDPLTRGSMLCIKNAE